MGAREHAGVSVQSVADCNAVQNNQSSCSAADVSFRQAQFCKPDKHSVFLEWLSGITESCSVFLDFISMNTASPSCFHDWQSGNTDNYSLFLEL